MELFQHMFKSRISVAQATQVRGHKSDTTETAPLWTRKNITAELNYWPIRGQG